MPRCPQCEKEVPDGSKFCRFCAHPLDGQALELDASLSENLAPEVLARRISPDEMRGLLNKAVVVEEAHSALLFLGGRLDQTLGPGKHSIGSILSSKTRDAEVVLFQTSDVLLDVSAPRLLSSDPLPLSLDFRLMVKIEEPLRFWQNLAQGADSYTTGNLAAATYSVVVEGCQAFVSSRSVRELGGRQETGQELGLSLASRLEQPLTRWGLRLVSCQAVSIHCEAWDEVNQARIEYSVATFQGQADLEGRKRLFDVYQESEIQTMAEETSAVIGVEKRVSLWARLRQALLSNAQEEIRSKAGLEDIVRQADKEKLLKEDEHDSLARAFAEAKEDHEKGRSFLLRRVEAEEEYELKKLDLGHRFGLSRERLSLEVSTARQEMEDRWELELRRLDLEIDQERRMAQFRREQEAEDRELRGRTQLGEARTAAAVAEIEREQQERPELEMLLDINTQYKASQRLDQQEQLRIRLEAQERELELTLREDREKSETRIRESRAQHGQELERIEVLSSVGIETLIAVSGPDQAQMLTQLARTRALSGCSPQQILAMQAESSPQVADALREILTATAADGQLEQYERLVAEIKDSARTSREDYQQNLATMGEMFNKALDSVKDTAVAFSSYTPAVAQHPDIRSHTAPDGTITLLFTDIEGSTAMTERLGDQKAQEVLRTHNAIFREHIGAHDGFEVKSMGDGFMLAFSSGNSGLGCAVSVQRSLTAYNAANPVEPIKVRMGLHTGETIKEGEDFFGMNVILAARISSKAHGGQILVSSLFKELTERGSDIQFGDVQEVELKGLAGTARIYPVLWE